MSRNSTIEHGERYLKVGPFVVFLSTDIPSLLESIDLLYEGFQTWPGTSGRFADFHVGVRRVGGARRFLRPQAVFETDGFRPFLPLATSQAILMFESGLNWSIAEQTSFMLVLHAGVVERDGRAIVLPAAPGSGKSTLCAALIQRGWRLFSDELALLSLETGRLAALARPISLKNESIAIVRDLAREVPITLPVADTLKGNVAYLKPPAESVARMEEPALPALIIVPKYVRQVVGAILEPKAKTDTFKELAEATYNFSLFGRRGFIAIAEMVDRCACFDLRFGNLEEAIHVCERAFDDALA